MKIHEYNEMMRHLTRREPSDKHLAASNPLNFPEHMIHQYEGGQLTPEEFYQHQSIPQSERPLTGAEGGRVYNTRKYLQGGRVGLKPGGLVEPGVTHYATTYADKKTKSINKAIEETNRRRDIQLRYNKKNNISATSIKKEITDILESIYERDYAKINVDSSIGHNLKKHLKSLKKKMKEAAENLEFEEAAKVRDEIRKLEASELEIGINPKIRQSKLQNKIYPEGRSTQGKPGTRPKRKR